MSWYFVCSCGMRPPFAAGAHAWSRAGAAFVTLLRASVPSSPLLRLSALPQIFCPRLVRAAEVPDNGHLWTQSFTSAEGTLQPPVQMQQRQITAVATPRAPPPCLHDADFGLLCQAQSLCLPLSLPREPGVQNERKPEAHSLKHRQHRPGARRGGSLPRRRA